MWHVVEEGITAAAAPLAEELQLLAAERLAAATSCPYENLESK